MESYKAKYENGLVEPVLVGLTKAMEYIKKFDHPEMYSKLRIQ